MHNGIPPFYYELEKKNFGKFNRRFENVVRKYKTTVIYEYHSETMNEIWKILPPLHGISSNVWKQKENGGDMVTQFVKPDTDETFTVERVVVSMEFKDY